MMINLTPPLSYAETRTPFKLMDNSPLIQPQIGIPPAQTDVEAVLDELVQRYLGCWWQTESAAPKADFIYPLSEKLRREKRLRSTVDALIAELKQKDAAPAARAARRSRVEALAAGFAQTALDLDADSLRVFLAAGFREAAFDFARRARAFDPDLSGADIYQAGRNAWSMNLFQYLFGLPVQVTPAVFAYSLLYPYTDNYLDDPALPAEEKRRANKRLTLRLAGKPLPPANSHEAHIFNLVGMIEGQFERARFPHVYHSLLAIQKAQVESLGLIQPHASPYEVDALRMCFKKGGAATLADGYLVAGTLTPAQQDFAFGYGAFTQLLDDQEDLLGDRAAGLMTVFSQTSYGWPLDGIVNRVFAFKNTALAGMREMEPSGRAPISPLVLRGIDLLIVANAGKAGHFHTQRYLRALEAGFPFRFSELERQQRRLFGQRLSFDRLMLNLIDE
jgi:hypothetical protein